MSARRKILPLLVTVAGLVVAPAFAEEEDPLFQETPTSEGKTELPKSGAIASTSNSKGAAGVSSWSSESPKGGGAAPLAASVSQNGKGGWVLKVFNNSEDEISASLEVVQKSFNQQVVKRDSASYTLKGKEQAERTFSAGPGAKDAVVELRSWKIKKKKSDDEGKPAGEGTPGNDAQGQNPNALPPGKDKR